MAYYLVRAMIDQGRVDELRARLDSGEIRQMRPFGEALHYSLNHARVEGDPRQLVWEEEDYCRPPLAQERAVVLDDYFSNLSVESVEEGQGWQQIEHLPWLWKDQG
jgi:hypothetical protein